MWLLFYLLMSWPTLASQSHWGSEDSPSKTLLLNLRFMSTTSV
jgi:hypothetical protein